MAIDPTVPLQIGQGVPALNNPLDTMAKYQGIANAQAQNKLIGANIAQTEQGTAVARQKALGNAAMSLMHLPDAELQQALPKELFRLAQDGVITREQAGAWWQNASKAPPPALRNMIHGVWMQTLPPGAQGDQVYATGQDVQQGDQLLSGVRLPPRVGGGFVANTAVPMAMSPEAKGAPVTTVGPNGERGTVPAGSLVDRFGNPRQPLPTGYPQPGAPPAKPFNATERPPADVADQDTYQADVKTVPDRNQRLAGLDEAHKALEIINSGKSTATLQKAREFLVARGITPDWVDTETNAYAKAKKYLIDYASNKGGRSDQALQAAIESNASTDIPNKAALDIVRNNIGQERLDLARIQSMGDRTGKGYLKHAERFSTEYDRRAFAADLIPEAERRKFFDALSPAEKEKFTKSLTEARRLGFVKF